MRRYRRPLGARLLTAIAHAILFLGAIIMVLPMLWMLVTSFKPGPEIAIWPPVWLPKEPTLANYSGVFETAPFGRFFLNSTGMSLVATLSVALTSLLAGAVFAKYRFPLRTALFGLIIATAIVPFESYMIPLYIQLNTIGWINTYQGIVLPTLFMSFGIFLMRQHVASAIPTDYLEAARIDGASEWRIFYSIMVPLASSVIFSTCIIMSVVIWNQFFIPLVFLQSDAVKTVPLKILSFTSFIFNRSDVALSGSVVATVPLLVLFFIFSKRIINSIVSGGIKG